jgi:hypothetical protein
MQASSQVVSATFSPMDYLVSNSLKLQNQFISCVLIFFFSSSEVASEVFGSPRDHVGLNVPGSIIICTSI